MSGFNPYFSIAKRLLRLRKKPITAKRLGAVWKLYPNDWIDNRLLIGRPFEREQLDFAGKYITSNQITVFFDCGANFGLYSVLLGVNAPDLERIEAFEPVARTYSRLVTNLELNELSAKAAAHNYGLGAKAENLSIAFDASSSGTATLDLDEKNNPKRHFKHREQVEIRTFDSQFTDKGQRAFLKLDVEGHEAEALKGMENFLTNNQCVLQIELWEKNQEKIETWLGKRGYFAFHNIHHDVYFKRNN